MYKKILCPIDGSTVSNRGMREAVRIAAALDARLLFLHVLDNTVFMVYPPIIEGLAGYMQKDSDKLLEKAQRSAAKSGVQAQVKVVEITHGRVAPVIVAEAKKYAANLIVMGTAGRRGIGALLMGSDALGVIGGCRVPVLLVK